MTESLRLYVPFVEEVTLAVTGRGWQHATRFYKQSFTGPQPYSPVYCLWLLFGQRWQDRAVAYGLQNQKYLLFGYLQKKCLPLI